MRKWYKYYLDIYRKGTIYLPIDSHFGDHSQTMGGYESDDSYKNKEDFFNKHFNDPFKRLENYDMFIREKISREDTILSIASGRCANELLLLEKGFNVVCSDLQKTECYEETVKLFPEFKFIEMDILKSPAEIEYDVVLCLSLIYLFDRTKLSLFFKNLYNSLKPKGTLILDSAGSPDNLASFLIHDIYLKYEVIAYRIVRFIPKRHLAGLIVKHHGYRRTDNEIVHAAKENGFKFLGKQHYAFLTDFRRSILFNKLITQDSMFEKIFYPFAKHVPYIRMFLFEKMD